MFCIMIKSATYALAGLQAASTQFAARADNIANVQTPNYRRAVPDQVSTSGGPQATVRREAAPEPAYPGDPANNVRLEEELVAAKLSETAYKAAARVLRAADETTEETLNILT